MPLYALKSDSNPILLELLLKNGAEQPESIANGTTLVHQAIEQNDVKLLEEVLLAGLEPNTVDSEGVIPLDYALKPANDLQMLELLLKNDAKIFRWWEDRHGLSPDGSSLIVRLAVKEKRLVLLEKLLNNSREAYPNKDNQGIAHKIFGHTDLGDCLGSKEAVLLLVKNGLTNIDPENYHEGEAEQMVKSFKEQAGYEKVTAGKEKLWYDGSLLESEPWSDRQACIEHGLVAGVQVKKKEGYNSISEIRLRHGSSWQPWRRTGVKDEGSVQEAFELDENEAVVAVRTNTDYDGWLNVV